MKQKLTFKKICIKLEKSIILLLEFILYGTCFAAFFLLFSIENRYIIGLSRTAAVTILTFVVMEFLLTGIYGKYDVGERKSKPIIYSITLATLITDVLTYVMLCIMNTNEENNLVFQADSLGSLVVIMLVKNIGVLLLVMAIQIVIITIFTHLGNNFYFWINEPENCLIITDEDQELGKLTSVIGQFKKRYQISAVMHYKEEELEQEILKVDTVFLYGIPVKERTEIINYCYKKIKNVYYNPEISDVLEKSSKQVLLEDMPFYSSEFHTMTFEQRILKRLMDIGISLLMLIITSPILLISSICIKQCDRGSVLFKQKRATIHGNVFIIYKFRTMKENVENYSVKEDDDRVTKIGKILRKYRIDELPQLFNVLKGNMSLVGPRPEMLENVEDYTRKMPEFKYRLRMKAGLTGYAQITGKYNTSSKDKLILDLMYIENYSVLKDIQLLFQTVMVLLKADESTEAFGEKKK